MYEFDSRIRYSETDVYGNLTIEALIDYFQDCSTFQSEDLNLGVSYLRQFHLAWVLSAWQITIEELPKLCDKVTIGTFPYEFRGFLGYRNFYMENEAGKKIAYANSIWTLLDTRTNRPTKPYPEILEGYILEEKLQMEYAPRKIVLPKAGQQQEEMMIKEYHLDSNFHVNNGQYVRIAGQYLKIEKRVKQIRVEYKKQAMLQDVMVPVVYEGIEKSIVALSNKAGEPYAIVELTT